MTIMSIESQQIQEDLELDKIMHKNQEQIQKEYTERIQYFYESYERSALKNEA